MKPLLIVVALSGMAWAVDDDYQPPPDAQQQPRKPPQPPPYPPGYQQYPQQPPPGYQRPQPQYPYQQYPQQQPYPQQAYPQYPQQPYPQYPQQQPRYPAYPQQPQQQQYPQAYPQTYPPGGYPAQAPQTAQAPAPPQKLSLTARDQDAVTLTWRCNDAIVLGRLAEARARCAEALAKDDQIALLHALLATLHPAQVARTEVTRAAELAPRVSVGERLFVDALRAMIEGRRSDAMRLFDQLVTMLPGEPRALVARGRFRLSADPEHAISDLRHATELDAKSPVAYSVLATALARRADHEGAMAAAKRAVELAPSDADARISLARSALAAGDLKEAEQAARQALKLDDKSQPSRLMLADVLLFSGRGKEARQQLAPLTSSADAATHHDGAMREARTFVFEGRSADAESALSAEVELSRRAKRPADELDALLELSRVQLDRSSLAEAGQSLRPADEILRNRDPEVAGSLSATVRLNMQAEAQYQRAMLLGAIGERQVADSRISEMHATLRELNDPHADQKAAALRGWLAARNHDDAAALSGLAQATRPTLKQAYALALARSGQTEPAIKLMRELANRTENDLEGALTRPRAQAWLKQQKNAPKKPASATPPATPPPPAAPVATPPAAAPAPPPASTMTILNGPQDPYPPARASDPYARPVDTRPRDAGELKTPPYAEQPKPPREYY
jgi:Flp pilus assembly protein TadD